MAKDEIIAFVDSLEPRIVELARTALKKRHHCQCFRCIKNFMESKSPRIQKIIKGWK